MEAEKEGVVYNATYNFLKACGYLTLIMIFLFLFMVLI